MTVCKRIGAWLLTLVLLVSALPYTAFAASEDSHVVNATMEETSVEDIADNVTTQLLRGAKTKDETLSMEAKPTHEDSDSVEIIVVVDDSVAKPTAQAQVQSLLQKQEKAAATMSRAIGGGGGAGASVYDAAQRLLRHCDLRPVQGSEGAGLRRVRVPVPHLQPAA